MAGVLQRLLTRSGILPVLRARWREDLVATSDKLEKRIDKRFDALTQDIERLRNELAERDVTERLSRLDRELRVLRVRSTRLPSKRRFRRFVAWLSGLLSRS